jgi:hypothetical protein
MLRVVVQWLAFIAVTVGSVSAALAWVFHKTVDQPFPSPTSKATIPVRIADPEPSLPPSQESEPVRSEVSAATRPPAAAVEEISPVQGDDLDSGLRRCLVGDREIDPAALFRLAQGRRIEVQTLLTEWIEPGRGRRLIDGGLLAFATLARMGYPMKSPHRVIELARGGHPVALEAAARIGDARAVNLFVEILRRRTSSETHTKRRAQAAFFARYTNSPRVSAELNGMAAGGDLTAVESLAHIGWGADKAMLTSLSRTTQNSMIRLWAVRALEAEEILSSAHVRERLLEALKKPESRGPLYNWTDWALEKMVRMKLPAAAESLRRYFDRISASPHGLPDGGGRTLYHLKVLRAIQQLGGSLSVAETEAVESNPLAE